MFLLQLDRDASREARFAQASFKVDGDFVGSSALNSVPSTSELKAAKKSKPNGDIDVEQNFSKDDHLKEYSLLEGDQVPGAGDSCVQDEEEYGGAGLLSLDDSEIPSSPVPNNQSELVNQSDSSVGQSDSIRRSSRPVVPSKRILESDISLKRRLSADVDEKMSPADKKTKLDM